MEREEQPFRWRSVSFFDSFGLSRISTGRCGKLRSRYTTEDELNRLQHLLGEHAWLPFRLMLETGIRVGDAVKAKRGDLYRAEDGTPRFRWTAQKTGKAGDAIISEHLFSVLTSGRSDPETWLFPGRGKAGHITRQALWYRIKTAARFAHLDVVGVCPHSMRKVAAVNVRRQAGFRAAKNALQHTWDATAALYAYSDAMAAPDTPITWGELELFAEFVAEKVLDRLDKGG